MVVAVLWVAVLLPTNTDAYSPLFPSTRGRVVSQQSPRSVRILATTTTMRMLTEETPDPSTFREAEVLGLRLMQEGNFQEALVGTCERSLFLLACV